MTPMEQALRREAVRVSLEQAYKKVRVPIAALSLLPGVGRDDGEPRIELNRRGQGMTARGFVPVLLAVAGKREIMAAIERGEAAVEVWMPERVAAAVIQADHFPSSDELRGLLSRALNAKYPAPKDSKNPMRYIPQRVYVREVYPLEDYAIVDISPLKNSKESSGYDGPTPGQTYKQRYKVQGKDKVVLVGKPIPVDHKYVERDTEKVVRAGSTLPEVIARMQTLSPSPATQAPGAGVGPRLNRDGSPANGISTRLQPLPGVGKTGQRWGATGSDLSKAQPRANNQDRARFGARNSELAQRARKGGA